MQIIINSDSSVDADEEVEQQVTDEITTVLARFAGRLTRVEVHLGDENADKPGEADQRCMLEVRPSGQPPLAVTEHAATPPAAWRGAAHKMRNLLETRFARADARGSRDSIRHPGPSSPPDQP